MSKDEQERQQHEAARVWAQGLDLKLHGVDLADTLAYSFLTVTGRIWLAHLTPEPSDPTRGRSSG